MANDNNKINLHKKCKNDLKIKNVHNDLKNTNTNSRRLSNTVNLELFVVQSKKKIIEKEVLVEIEKNNVNNKKKKNFKQTTKNLTTSSCNNFLNNDNLQQKVAPVNNKKKNFTPLNLQKRKKNDQNIIKSASDSANMASEQNFSSQNFSRREKDDYCYYDNQIRGFFYEINGCRGWRKGNQKIYSMFLAMQQKYWNSKDTIQKSQESQASSSASVNYSQSFQQKQIFKKTFSNNQQNINNNVQPFLQQPQNLSYQNALKNKNAQKYYDAATDGYFYEIPSVDGWFRRQPLSNLSLNYTKSDNIKNQLQLPVQTQFSQPKNCLNSHVLNSTQNLSQLDAINLINQAYLSNALIQTQDYLTLQKILQRLTNNIELEKMLCLENQSIYSSEVLAKLQFNKQLLLRCLENSNNLLLPEKKNLEQYFLNSAQFLKTGSTISNNMINKNALSTPVNTLYTSPNFSLVNSHLKLQNSQSKTTNKKNALFCAPIQNFWSQDFLEKNKLDNSSSKSLSIPKNNTYQRQESSQTGSLDDYYDFYNTDEDKTSINNTPSTSSLDEMSVTTGDENRELILQLEESRDNAFLINCLNNQKLNNCNSKKNVFSRTVRRPNSSETKNAFVEEQKLDDSKHYNPFDSFYSMQNQLLTIEKSNLWHNNESVNNFTVNVPRVFGGFGPNDSFVNNSFLTSSEEENINFCSNYNTMKHSEISTSKLDNKLSTSPNKTKNAYSLYNNLFQHNILEEYLQNENTEIWS